MGFLRTVIIFQLVYFTTCMDQLQITHEWKSFMYYIDDPAQAVPELQDVRPDAYMPTSVAMDAETGRIFLAFPKLRSGVVSSLNVLYGEGEENVALIVPYPSWKEVNEDQEVVSPFKIHIDRCRRLWVLDSGKVNMLEANSTQLPPAIVIYDLQSNTLLRRYPIPADQVKEDSWFINIAVEDTDCEKTYAYAADMGKAGVVVYSFEKNDSWRITHHYFHPDPLACDFNVKGYNFSLANALYGLALSAPNADNFSTLYFHPMSSFNEFIVSTEYLRNQTIADDNFDAFKLIGARGPNAQSTASFIDPETGVLFYSLVNLNAVACWRTSNKEYTMKNQGRIYMNDTTMVYPVDIKVYNGTVWILSNKYPVFKYGTMDPNEINFRLFSARVVEAISHTACDIKPRLDILDKFVKGVTNLTGKVTGASNINVSSLFVVMMGWFLSVTLLS